MIVFSKKTAISLACAAVLGGLFATPSLAGVITPADKETVSAETPLEFVGWRRVCHWHCHIAWRPSHHCCVVATDYPRYGWCHHRHYYERDYYVVTPAYYVATPVYYVAYPTWGWGWGGGGGLLGGLFGI